jgi:hypothetical protein
MRVDACPSVLGWVRVPRASGSVAGPQPVSLGGGLTESQSFTVASKFLRAGRIRAYIQNGCPKRLLNPD